LEESAKVNKDLKRLLFEEKGWTLKKESKTCHVFCIPSGRPDNYIWKGEATILLKPEKIFDMVHPTAKYRLMWDLNVASCELLEEITDRVFVTHTTMKAHLLGLLSARDTIEVFVIEETDQYYSCQFGGVEYDNVPLAKDCVRAWSYPSGIFIFKNDIKPDQPAATRVVTFIQMDAKLDVVPPALLNATMPTFMKQYFKSMKKAEEIEWTPLVDVPGRRHAK